MPIPEALMRDPDAQEDRVFDDETLPNETTPGGSAEDESHVIRGYD
jgi:hypothetical protein